MHHLHPTMEKFYLGILNYAGLEIRDDVIVNKHEKLGDFMVEGKHVALPYMNLLKDPKGRMFFHLLNENYASPENAVFNLFKDRLVLELNLRMSSLVVSLIALAADPQLQQKVTSGPLIKLISDIGETDMTIIEEYLAMTKAGKKAHNEGFNFDVFLKKNGEVRGTPFAAIGKINFRMYEDIRKSLDSPEKEYKVFGKTFRKKDLLVVSSVFSAIFPGIDDKEVYIEGTDNKIFRYLNVLLKTTYLVAKRMNEIADLLLELKEPALNAEEIVSPLNWVECLEPLYGMATEIRIIPSQVDINVEAKRISVDETKAAQAPQQVTQQPAQAGFNPVMAQQAQQQTLQQPMQQPIQQQVQQPQRQLTPEEIVRGSMGMPQTGMQMQMPVMQGLPGVQPMPVVSGMGVPMVINPTMQPQVNTPAWVQLEMMKEQQRQMQPQMQQVNLMPGMIPQQQFNPMLQQQLLQQQLLQQQAQMMPQMQQMQQVPGQIPINPLFAGQVRAPWN